MLFRSRIVAKDEGGIPGCPSGVTDPACVEMFGRLWLDVETGPRRDPLLRALTLEADERADALAFLETLTDEGFLTGLRSADPWQGAKTRSRDR